MSSAGPDTGDIDPAVAACLRHHASDPSPATYQSLLAALRESRLLVAVVASADRPGEMAAAGLVGEDGRVGLVAFTHLDALRSWRSDARPMPFPATDLAASALADGHAALLIDPVGPVPVTVEAPALEQWSAGVELAGHGPGHDHPDDHDHGHGHPDDHGHEHDHDHAGGHGPGNSGDDASALVEAVLGAEPAAQAAFLVADATGQRTVLAVAVGAGISDGPLLRERIAAKLAQLVDQDDLPDVALITPDVAGALADQGVQPLWRRSPSAAAGV